MPPSPVLHWFRQDLRLADNPSLAAAAQKGPVAALYVLDETLPWTMGAASRAWLHHSLLSLSRNLAEKGIPLILRRGPAKTIVPDVAHAIGAQAVVWNRVYEPAAIARDTVIKDELKKRGVTCESHNAALLFEPWSIKNKEGNPFRVFTPFARACRAAGFASPLPLPQGLSGVRISCASDDLHAWPLLPHKPDWATPMLSHWRHGEDGALEALKEFLAGPLASYAQGRDRPDRAYTSRLSPHLHFGEIGPRQVMEIAAMIQESGQSKAPSAALEKFISEILWREFSYHLLYAFPSLPEEPLHKNFSCFPWQNDGAFFQAWRRGQTGFPIIDAGMRQLWQQGWMHNRVRMIAASFLVKNLLQPWQEGEKWFWDTLVDADLASNATSWQWVAGCGADAAPFFRIFNPVLQGQKFDPEGEYVRRYVPELKNLPARVIHAPWEAGENFLAEKGVFLGKTYPRPIIDLAESRIRALEAYARIKAS